MEYVPESNSWGWFGECVMEQTVYEEPDNQEWVVMQSTGLKDKNGKEIFEQDILKIHDHWDDSWNENNLIVEYQEGHFFPFGTGDWEPDEDDVEIIGNVHENPDLLPKDGSVDSPRE